MYKVSADIRKSLKRKFPNCQNLDEIINELFIEIRDKAFNDGSCLINMFGTFYTYKSFSRRKNKYVPRFKFKISRALSNSFIDDQFLLDKIDKTIDRLYDNNKNEKYQKERDSNLEQQKMILNNQKKIKKRINENLVKDEISEILEGNNDE